MLDSQRRKVPRGADGFSRLLFILCLWVAVSFVSSCARTSGPAQGAPGAAHSRPTGPPQVVQVDDARIRQLLKPSGKPLLVNFWATWCSPCREEFPDLVQIDAEYRGKIDLFTVSLDFAEELNTGVPKFLREMKAEMPTYLLVSSDENSFISSVSKDWSGALPFTILYDEKGKAAFLRQGKVSRETLKDEINRILSEKK